MAETQDMNEPSVAALNADEDSFFGMKFPLGYGIGTEGFFPRSGTIKEQASSNIKNLLLTQKGERVGQPEFGSDLPRIIFEPLEVDVLKESIDQTIKEALSLWLPYITVQTIGVYQDNANPNQVVVQLEFSVDVEDPEAPETLTFTFEQGG